MAIRLKQAGIDDFVVLERADEVGGTWQANTYPGCACDVPSHLYSFSFAPNPDWTQTYSTQPEIWAYLRRCADRYGIRPHVRLALRGRVRRPGSSDERRWELETSDGVVRARVLVAGMGPLTEPRIPEIPGLEAFEGDVFHSARWDHDVDLAGKRVASIGTGASAIQYVPEIAKQVEQLHVFQRTPPWVLPHSEPPDPRLGAAPLPRAARRPAARCAAASTPAARRSCSGSSTSPRLMKVVERLARKHMEHQIDDPELLREGHARLHDRLQADPALQPLVPRARAGRTSSS